MITQRCPYCDKQVREKRVFGTMHVCLTDDERAEKIIRMRLAQRGQLYPDEDLVQRAKALLVEKWSSR